MNISTNEWVMYFYLLLFGIGHKILIAVGVPAAELSLGDTVFLPVAILMALRACNKIDEQTAQQQQRSGSESYWEHRFNVINGKYVAEVPALHDRIRQLEKQLQERGRL